MKPYKGKRVPTVLTLKIVGPGNCIFYIFLGPNLLLILLLFCRAPLKTKFVSLVPSLNVVDGGPE